MMNQPLKKQRTPRYLIISACIYLFSLTAFSEVYQWTDANGQTHFGDRPPSATASTNISNKVNQINITSDLSSPEMMLRQAQQRDEEAKKRQQAWQQKQKNKPSKQEACKEAKRYLKSIKGRVVFVDENGKDLKLSEANRKKTAKELNNTIQKNCQ